MSLYRSSKSPYWQYSFQVRGARFHGSTGSENRREAETIERRAKQEAVAKISTGKQALTLNLAAGRYYTEVGQHHAAPQTTWKNIERLVDYFGAVILLNEITDNDVAKLVAMRRAQRVKGKEPAKDKPDLRPFVSAATVNRSIIEPLQKIFNRATSVWGEQISSPPHWRSHLLKEPQERVREVARHEEASLKALRPEYRLVVDFALAAGLRQNECLLRKSEVDLLAGRITTFGKGGKAISRPITPAMRAILMQAMANPTEFVFAYAAQRTVKAGRANMHAQVRGEFYPITQTGIKSIWKRARGADENPIPKSLRFHDLRHDFATKLLRETGNLRLVQRALNHAKIETTTKYAHVLDEDLLAGMTAAEETKKKRK